MAPPAMAHSHHGKSNEHFLAATVVVIGDIGHSPRMCNHAMSLALHGCHVNLVGYTDSTPHESLSEQKNIRIISVPQYPTMFSSSNSILQFIFRLFKLVWLLFTITYTLITKCDTLNKNPRHKILLVQNPPGIPTLLICYVVSKIRRTTYIVDWHNYTFSMLSSKWSFLVGSFEGFLGRHSDLNFCVSKAMEKDLQKRWNISASTLYDRPPKWIFKNITTDEKFNFLSHCFAMKLNDELTSSSTYEQKNDNQGNLFTYQTSDGITKLCENRPFLLVSSTSWTPDEDFSILFEALKKLDFHLKCQNDKQSNYPNFIVVITGKGPLKQYYLGQISLIKWEKIRIYTAWLSAEDYPKLLSCANIGVSLHTSTSGFDLPMKIVDMFGCKLPVLAKRFATIHELVQDNVNGILFDTSEELFRILAEISLEFPHNQKLIEMHKAVKEQAQDDWQSNWDAVFWSKIASNEN